MSNQPVQLRESPPNGLPGPSSALPFEARVLDAGGDKGLTVGLPTGEVWHCEILQTSALPVEYKADDRVLVLPLGTSAMPVVVGRICSVADAAQAPAVLQIVAQQSMSLRCGDASVDLRTDGKVMIRGDDVLVRAKGSQRIRAGTVSIN